MNFNYSDDQLSIKDSAMKLFSDVCSDEAIRELYESKQDIHSSLWQQLADLGMLGLMVDESYGGSGLSLAEFCVLLEIQGQFVVPIPLLSSMVECSMAINDSSNEALKRQLLPKVSNGEMVLSPVRIYNGLLESSPLTATQQGDDWLLSGRSGYVPYLPIANGLVISLDGLLVYVDANQQGVDKRQQRTISDEVGGYIEFNQCLVSASQVLEQDDAANQLIQLQMSRSWIALAAIQTGVLTEGLKRMAEYVSQRKQFGRALGSFQAVSQQAADAYMDVEALRSVYWRALDVVEHQERLFDAAAVAKYWVSVAGHSAGHKILHLHGGIGQDLSYPIHRYFLWAKQCERYLGSASHITPLLGQSIANDVDSYLM